MACRTNQCVFRIVWVLMLVGIASLAMLLFAPPAKGEALLMNRASCIHLGSLAVDVVETKAAGVTWDKMEAFMKEKLAEARKNPESYVQSDADVAYVLRMLKGAWDSKEPSYEAGAAVYRDCMAKRV